ncbi:unnamed protein product, partial [Brassica napus]
EILHLLTKRQEIPIVFLADDGGLTQTRRRSGFAVCCCFFVNTFRVLASGVVNGRLKSPRRFYHSVDSGSVVILMIVMVCSSWRRSRSRSIEVLRWFEIRQRRSQGDEDLSRSSMFPVWTSETPFSSSALLSRRWVFHLRTTILPAEEEMPEIMESFMKFNDEFMSQYGDNFGYSRM